MVIDYLLILSSLLAIFGVGALSYGYRASLFSADPATRWFAWSMALLCTSVFWRRFTWDIWDSIVVAGRVDQRPLNLLFNLICIAAVYAGLQARLMLIPEAERPRWHWWNAWTHPSIWELWDGRPIGPHEER